MKIRLSLFLSIILISSCNYISYTPRSNKTIRRETPSVLLCEKVVEFRLDQQRWPVSKEDIISKGGGYYQVFENFPYSSTTFKIIDSNRMTLYFAGHIKDRLEFEKTQKVDLNNLSGSIRFFKENGKFIYKIKMN